jgi:hypothetical protein
MSRPIPNRSIYCLRCKKQTISKNVYLHEQEHPKKKDEILYRLTGTCSVCSGGLSQFVSNKTGGCFMNDLLNSGKLPELHLPGHNYTGPGTILKERLLRGDKPVMESTT